MFYNIITEITSLLVAALLAVYTVPFNNIEGLLATTFKNAKALASGAAITYI